MLVIQAMTRDVLVDNEAEIQAATLTTPAKLLDRLSGARQQYTAAAERIITVLKATTQKDQT